MDLWVEGAIIALAAVAAVSVMFLVRRRAPVGGFFADSDRAAGVFGVLGTAFAVLLAFIIFLAFDSYGNAKEKASVEAVAVTELFGTADFFAPAERDTLRGQVICYARSVIHDEWRTMRDDRESRLVEAWLADLETSIERLDVRGARQAAGLQTWLQRAAERREGRRGRLAEAAPFVPAPLWMVLILGAAVLVIYMCFYADPGEARPVQAMMIAAVTGMVVAGLLTVRFLDHPYENRSGSIKPVEMTRTLQLIERGKEESGLRIPCDALGRRV